MCHLNPILLTSFKGELNPQHCQHPHYGGRDHNGFHRSHPTGLQQRSTLPQTTWKSKMCMLHVYNLQKTSHKILQAEQTHQSHCILQKIHKQLQKFQGQRAINHPFHTRSRPGSDLLCEHCTTDFLYTRNEEPDGCNQQFSKDTTSLYR